MEIVHWSDKVAEKVINNKKKDKYVCASAVTPSGMVHFGNFREVMTVALVNQSINELGYKSIHFHQWDDFDRFKKVPRNVSSKWNDYVGMPLREVPDPWGCHDSYAEHMEADLLENSKKVGLKIKFVSAYENYLKRKYSKQIKLALDNREKIIEILNKYRKEPLDGSWFPVQVYCSKCGKDSTKIINYDGNYKITYSCKCGFSEEIDFRKKGKVKLRWRVDWPMKWAYYDIDFEPGGKEHSTIGGSYDTSKFISKLIFNKSPPVYLMYDFIKLKGDNVKMSGSIGNALTLGDVLKYYLPELTRFFYAKPKPNTEIELALGVDLIKFYEDFYKYEKVYFNELIETNEKEKKHMNRVYELSMIKLPNSLPIQPSLRLISDSLQTFGYNEKETMKFILLKLQKKDSFSKKRVVDLIKIAKNWIEKYAPNELVYKFSLDAKLTEKEIEKIRNFINDLKKVNTLNQIKEVVMKHGKENPKEFFQMMYKALFNKKRGPRLAEFIYYNDKKKVINHLMKLIK